MNSIDNIFEFIDLFLRYFIKYILNFLSEIIIYSFLFFPKLAKPLNPLIFLLSINDLCFVSNSDKVFFAFNFFYIFFSIHENEDKRYNNGYAGMVKIFSNCLVELEEVYYQTQKSLPKKRYLNYSYFFINFIICLQ